MKRFRPRRSPVATITTPTPAPTPTPLPATDQGVIALNKTEDALLQYVGQQGVTLVSHAYDALELHPQAGHHARKKLGDLGLLSAGARGSKRECSDWGWLGAASTTCVILGLSEQCIHSSDRLRP